MLEAFDGGSTPRPDGPVVRLANLSGRACLIRDGKSLDINRASGGRLPSDPMAYSAIEALNKLRDMRLDAVDMSFEEFDERLLGPPIPRPGKILAIALNYSDHALETSQTPPLEPVFFAKLPSSLCGPFDPITIPPGREEVDYEAEVVIVIGRRIRGVAAADVWSNIAGIMAGQDISDRAEQLRPPISQYTVSKSYDTFSPVGPVMATVDEFERPDDVSVLGWISGRQVQAGRTTQMIHPIPYLVAWLCRYITLDPGDLIFTGTPSGVGMQRNPPLFLRPGMVLETEVQGLGRMRNPIWEAATAA